MNSLIRKIIGTLLTFILFMMNSNGAYARVLFESEYLLENSGSAWIIDSKDDVAGDLTLQFGNTLGETLTWNSAGARFDLSDDLSITGGLTTTGITTLGNNTSTVEVNSSSWDISTAGAATGLTGITSTGSIDFSGASAINIPHTTTSTFTLDNDNAGAGANVDIIANQGTDLDGTLRYNATSNEWELSNNGGTFNVITTGLRQTSSAVQARQAGAYSLNSATWVDITFDTTDIETNAAAVEHNNVNTERIDIKETGLYLIGYSLNLDEATATGTWDSRVLLNGTTPVNGSVQANSNYQGEYVASNTQFYASLTAGDYITLQAQRVTANALSKTSDPTLTVVKMEGIKGDKGDQGLPGSAGLGTNEVSFTLDQDNAGAGANVDIIANQGTDLDGTLRYDATNNRWQINNNNAGFNDLHMANVFFGYDNTGGQTINATEATVNIDTTVISDSNYTLAADEVTINETGLYRITGSIGYIDTNTTGGARATTELTLQNNAADLPGGAMRCYHRETTENSCQKTIIASLTAADVVRLRIIRVNGTTNYQTLAPLSSLLIERIR